MFTHPKAKNLKGERNQCTGCGHLFNSVKAFDKHRRGTPGVDRRCLSPDEMHARGMTVSSRGFWIGRPNTDRVFT